MSDVVTEGSSLERDWNLKDCNERRLDKVMMENDGGDKNGVHGGTLGRGRGSGVEEEEEVWVGCGSNICIISLEDLSLAPDIVKVASGVDGAIEGIVHTQGSVWCFTSQSRYVFQYSVGTRRCVSILDCNERAPKSASQILLAPEAMQELMTSWKEKEKAQELASTTALCGQNSNRDCRQPSVDETILQEELPMVDDHFIAPIPPRRQSRLRRARLTIPRLTASAAKYSDNKVTCLLAVENVLWIGRSSGDIVLVNLEDEGIGTSDGTPGLRFGSVVTTLTPKPLVHADCGKVLELHLVGNDRVVACHSGNKPGDPAGHINDLLVWENWDMKRVGQFRASALSRASTNQVSTANFLLVHCHEIHLCQLPILHSIQCFNPFSPRPH